MKTNKMLKFISSIPVIVIIGYYIPFIAVCLILIRYFVYKKKKHYYTYFSLIILSLLMIIPRFITKVIEITKLEKFNFSYLNIINNSEIYSNILDYSKFLFTVGIIFLLISVIFKNLFDKAANSIKSYINSNEKIDAENRRKNDMKMKIKQEQAKTTNVIHCPHCGGDNILTKAVGKCKYCRRGLSNKEKR